ncbi:hypothetical protein VP01_6395g2 [Puccinia sorghi]|uniref:Uncharacterized protein n=1 Tax=Puccinia sorghi TaxID=27349 RepID=A0A0L6UFX2_9BASI|nr:hypothetical protein VP01_6395g2 [Puccinia sorghi]
MLDREPNIIADQKPSMKAASNKMDKLEQTILKKVIEAITLLTIDSFSLWKNQIENIFDLQELYNSLTSKKAKITKSQAVQLRTILTSKLDSSIRANLIDHNNEKDTRAIWKSISNYYYASSQASNLDISEDIVTYLILNKLPSALDDVSKRIAHPEKGRNPELALEQLWVYYNDQQAMGGGSGSKDDPIALLTNNSRKCKENAHNPLFGHSESNCWMLWNYS